MDRVHVIRHKFFNEGLSIRRISRELKVSRPTIRKYLFEQSEPKRQPESKPRARPVLEEVRGRIDAIVEEWEPRTTRKQRLTGTLVHKKLREEGYQVGSTTVRDYLAEKRRQKQEVFIPLVWRAGDAAQVDFFEVTVEVAGERRKAWKFVMRLMYSGRDFVWIYDRCNQIAFLDGHVRAFAHFGSVPARCIYDNLTEAVKRRVGVQRELTDRFLALSSHYLFEPCFARPGEGHDKGGVEARGKNIRLQHLTPMPRGESLEQIAAAVLEQIDQMAHTPADPQGRTVAERFEEEQRHMRALPPRPFEARQVEPVGISRQALVRVDGAQYSVPSHWHSRQAMAYVGVADILIACGGEQITVSKQPRGGRAVKYRHYLDELSRKPQAMRQVAPELMAELGDPYVKLWALLSCRYGELDAARVMAKLAGAIVEHGEQLIAETLQDILGARPGSPSGPHQAPARVAVPSALSHYVVESTPAATYDALLEAQR